MIAKKRRRRGAALWGRPSEAKLWALPAHKSVVIAVHVRGDDIVARGLTGEDPVLDQGGGMRSAPTTQIRDRRKRIRWQRQLSAELGRSSHHWEGLTMRWSALFTQPAMALSSISTNTE